MTDFAPAPQSQGPNPFDAAETFAESGVTLLSDDTRLSDGSVRIGPKDGTEATRTDDGTTTTADLAAGQRVTPETELVGVEATVSANTTGATEVFIADLNETILASKTNPGTFSPGDKVRLFAPLDPAESYFVGVYGGGEFTHGSFRNNTSYNNSADISYDQASFGAGATGFHPDDSGSPDMDGNAHGVNGIRALVPALSASAAIEWPAPDDVYEWDCATYQQSPDGETVEVYAARNDGTGWARVNGGDPIGRCYSLADDPEVSPSDNVRVEVKLERQDTSNNPRLDAAYRSWRV